MKSFEPCKLEAPVMPAGIANAASTSVITSAVDQVIVLIVTHPIIVER